MNAMVCIYIFDLLKFVSSYIYESLACRIAYLKFADKQTRGQSSRAVVLGTCTCTRVVLEYKSRVLVLVLATLSSKY